MNKLLLFLIVFSSFLYADVIQIDVTNDFRVRNVGVANTLNDDTLLETFNSGSGFETRAMLEFNISVITAGSSVNSLDIELSTNSGFPTGLIEVHGYIGNGANDASDALGDNFLGNLSPLAGVNTYSIPTAFLQSLVNNGNTFMGIQLRQAGSTGQAVFDSIEAGFTSQLIVEFGDSVAVPEPSTSLAFLLGLSMLGIYRKYR